MEDQRALEMRELRSLFQKMEFDWSSDKEELKGLILSLQLRSSNVTGLIDLRSPSPTPQASMGGVGSSREARVNLNKEGSHTTLYSDESVEHKGCGWMPFIWRVNPYNGTVGMCGPRGVF